MQTGTDVVRVLVDGHANLEEIEVGRQLTCSLFQFRDDIVHVGKNSECLISGEVKFHHDLCCVYVYPSKTRNSQYLLFFWNRITTDL